MVKDVELSTRIIRSKAKRQAGIQEVTTYTSISHYSSVLIYIFILYPQKKLKRISQRVLI